MPRMWLVRAGILVVVAATSACTQPNPEYVNPSDADSADGRFGDAQVAPDADLRTWSSPERIFASTSYSEAGPVVSPDGKELFYYGAQTSGSLFSDIFVYTRHATTEAWTPNAAAVVQVNSTASTEGSPAISSDGLDLYFSRGGDLYSAHRTSTVASWNAPTPLGSSGDKPRISSDNLTLYYYDSSLTCPSGVCLRKRVRSTVGAVWSSPTDEMFPDGGGGYQEMDVSGDGLQILLSAPISLSTAPIATAHRVSLTSAWSPVTPIAELNLFSGIRYARWTWDRQQIYFAVSQGSSNNDIYSSHLQ